MEIAPFERGSTGSHITRRQRMRCGTNVDAYRSGSVWNLEDVNELVEPSDNVRSIDEQSVRERMMELIRKLRGVDRDILLLYLEGMDAKEIADIVGLSPSNVAQKISRTKKILTAYFQPGDSHGLS